jgi:hypothetical protein
MPELVFNDVASSTFSVGAAPPQAPALDRSFEPPMRQAQELLVSEQQHNMAPSPSASKVQEAAALRALDTDKTAWANQDAAEQRLLPEMHAAVKIHTLDEREGQGDSRRHDTRWRDDSDSGTGSYEDSLYSDSDEVEEDGHCASSSRDLRVYADISNELEFCGDGEGDGMGEQACELGRAEPHHDGMMTHRNAVSISRMMWVWEPLDLNRGMGTRDVAATTLVDVVAQGAQDKHVQSMLAAVARARIEVCACQELRRLCITVTLAAVLPANVIVSRQAAQHVAATGAGIMARRSAVHATTSLGVGVKHARLRPAGTWTRNQAQAKENQRMRLKPQHQARAAHRPCVA